MPIPPTTEQNLISVMNGSRRGMMAGGVRLALALLEPMYAGVTRARNAMYDRGLARVTELGRPTIAVGNLTTGGTGKTPMVRWIATRLRDAGERVAVISRGYKSTAGKLGDEQIMLDHLLNGPGKVPVILAANPDRVAAAQQVLAAHPEVSVFVLDDAFQHRRVAREVDIVLISAMEPFGFGHVLPRGLLREPISGLRRAGAVVITHADQAEPSRVAEIERVIWRYNRGAPVFQAVHGEAGFRSAAHSSALPADKTRENLQQRRLFLFCGIGSPQSFEAKVRALGAQVVGSRWFGDHHAYAAKDLAEVRQEARHLGADLLLTTEKDWVKVAAVGGGGAAQADLEIWRMDVEMDLLSQGERQLMRQVLEVIRSGSADCRAQSR